MHRNLNILMLGGAKRVAMAEQLIRAGKRLGCNVKIFSHELSNQEPIASIGTIITGLRYSDPAVDAELDEIIARHKIHVVLPFVDPAIEVAARCKQRHSDVFVPVSSPEVSRAMFDKVLAAELYEQNGIAIPATYSPENIAFPAILKPRTGSASRGIIVARSIDEVQAAPMPLHQYLIQQYIEHREELTVDCYVGTFDHEAKCTVPRIRLATAGGEAIRTITQRNPELEKTAKSVLSALHLEGPVTLQSIPDTDAARYLLMAITPRLGGGVICSICAGADIASMIIEEAQDLNAMPRHDWRDKTLMTRYFKEVIFFNDSTDDEK